MYFILTLCITEIRSSPFCRRSDVYGGAQDGDFFDDLEGGQQRAEITEITLYSEHLGAVFPGNHCTTYVCGIEVKYGSVSLTHGKVTNDSKTLKLFGPEYGPEYIKKVSCLSTLPVYLAGVLCYYPDFVSQL